MRSITTSRLPVCSVSCPGPWPMTSAEGEYTRISSNGMRKVLPSSKLISSTRVDWCRVRSVGWGVADMRFGLRACEDLTSSRSCRRCRRADIDIFVKLRHRPGLAEAVDDDGVVSREGVKHPLTLLVLHEQVDVLPVLFDQPRMGDEPVLGRVAVARVAGDQHIGIEEVAGFVDVQFQPRGKDPTRCAARRLAQPDVGVAD